MHVQFSTMTNMVYLQFVSSNRIMMLSKIQSPLILLQNSHQKVVFCLNFLSNNITMCYLISGSNFCIGEFHISEQEQCSPTQGGWMPASSFHCAIWDVMSLQAYVCNASGKWNGGILTLFLLLLSTSSKCGQRQITCRVHDLLM